MPEGDTVHKLAAYLADCLPGRSVAELRLLGQPVTGLGGVQVTGVGALGKHLLIHFADGQTLRSHLGMYGSWHRYRVGEEARDPQDQPGGRRSIELTAGGEVFACLNAEEVELFPTDGVRHRALRDHLGPDLLAPAPAGVADELAPLARRARALRPPGTLIVDVLLDQRIAAGIGNVYKSEILFLEHLDPHHHLGDLTPGTLEGLFTRARELLAANVAGGPRVTRPGADGAGRLWVYNRAALPCHVCRTPIRFARLGEPPRGTFWCPACQH